MEIEPYDDSRLDVVVRLSLRAWEPVFESIEKVMGADIFREQHPDWRVTQRSAVESVCSGPPNLRVCGVPAVPDCEVLQEAVSTGAASWA